MDLQCTLKLAKMGCVAVESGSFMQSSSPIVNAAGTCCT